MTLTEAKNQVAEQCGKKHWEELLSGQHHFMIESYWEKAAYLYAESKWKQACEDQKWACIKNWTEVENTEIVKFNYK